MYPVSVLTFLACPDEESKDSLKCITIDKIFIVLFVQIIVTYQKLKDILE